MGIFVLFLFVARLLDMSELVYIMDKAISVGITAFIILFQPELRKALEQIGQANINILGNFMNNKELFDDNTVEALVKATFDMAKVKTGALIVIEQKVGLSEYEKSGINLDAVLTSALLINIFEKNTPLHDGAVISDNATLSKDLGTRHRAALGVSEVTDSLTIVVSEETGKVAVAYKGELDRKVDESVLRNKLKALQNKQETTTTGAFRKKWGAKK